MRDVTVVDAAKITTGAVPAAALTNVDLVEGTKGTDIVSAGTMVIGTDGGYFDITGTTGISTMTVAAGRVFTLQFDAAVTLTHSSTLYLSGAADFTTEANDHMTFISVAANDVRQIGTGLKDGGSPVVAAGGVDGITTSANATAITISADEQVQMPLQPCFQVTAAAEIDQTGDGTVHQANLTQEVFDVGGNFASKQFTAPVTGKYLLCASLTWVAGQYGTTDAVWVEIKTSNRVYAQYQETTNYAAQNMGSYSMSAVADMDAADYAKILWYISGGSKVSDHAAGYYTVLSGILLA